MLTYADAKAEFRMTADGDDWGNALNWHFHVADEIYHNRAMAVPAGWQFRPSPLGPANDSEGYETSIVQDMSDGDLERFGAVLLRYARFLRHCGAM